MRANYNVSNDSDIEVVMQIITIIFITFFVCLLFWRYEEKELKVGRKKTNLMFIGDGMGKTVITGGVSVADNVTTFHTASFGKYKTR